MAIYDLSTAANKAVATATAGTSGTTFNTLSTTFTTPAILIGGVATSGGGTPAAGTGYTMQSSVAGDGSEYSANTISSPSSFTATGTSGYWVDVGVAYEAN